MPTARKGVCKVCRHPERARIEDLRTAGVSFDVLAERFGIARTIVFRHWKEHVSADRKLTFLLGRNTVDQLKVRAAEEGLTVLDSLSVVRSVLMSQLVAQGEVGAPIPLAAVAGRLLDILKEIGRITGEIHERSGSAVTVNLGVVHAPGFADLQAGLLQIARDHPDARPDIVALLRGLDGAGSSAPRLINGTALHA